MLPEAVSFDQVEIWFQDEARVGQRGTITRIWAPKGTRPRVVRQQQFTAVYVFGAVCPVEDKAYALVMPGANTEAMQQHLDGIAQAVDTGKHAVLVTDRAAWHMSKHLKCPSNLSLLPLPPYSPELNPVEQLWQQLRDRYWSNRCFKDYDEIVHTCCQGWNQFVTQPDAIRNLCSRRWAVLI